MIEIKLRHQSVSIVAEPNSPGAHDPEITVRNIEENCLSVSFRARNWIILARSANGLPSVYAFTTEASALEFLELAKPNFESLTWLQNPSERQA